jgi:WhiB family transcriptional regulator, redox-sensing transcriptional regulator
VEPAWSWRYDAKCKDEPTDLFYPPRDRALYKPIADKAKGICWGDDGRPPCPVRRDCLWYAIDMGDQHGIFGGMSNRERAHIGRRYTHERPGMSFKDWILTGDGGEGKRIKKPVAGLHGDEED